MPFKPFVIESITTSFLVVRCPRYPLSSPHLISANQVLGFVGARQAKIVIFRLSTDREREVEKSASFGGRWSGGGKRKRGEPTKPYNECYSRSLLSFRKARTWTYLAPLQIFFFGKKKTQTTGRLPTRTKSGDSVLPPCPSRGASSRKSGRARPTGRGGSC